MHTQLDARVGTARHAEMLDAVAQLLGVDDVLASDVRDALGIYMVELQRDTEGDGGQDGELMGGVDAFHVEGGVGLGIAEFLRLFEHVGEVATLVAHLGENEVAGAVDDAGQPFDAVARQALADRLDDGDAAGHGGLEGHHHAFELGLGEDFVAVMGDQRLVGGDHVLAVGDGLAHQVAGQIGAADQLDDDLHLGVVDDLHGVGGQPDTGGLANALTVQVTRRRVSDLDAAPCPARDFLRIAAQHVDGAAADRTQT
jgi:hypothetical protein